MLIVRRLGQTLDMSMLAVTILVLSVLLTAKGMPCYQCEGAISLAECTHVTECQPGQICLVREYIDDKGRVLYNLGCTEETSNCTDPNTAGEKLLRSKCCSGAYCNVNADDSGQSKVQTGTRCFSCPNVAKPIDCTHVETCKAEEECITSEKQSHENRLSYSMGCRSKRSCEVIKHTPIIGKRAIGRQCEECCSSSLCNDMLCSTPNTTTVTTVGRFVPLHLTVVPHIQVVKIGASAEFECKFEEKVNQSMKMTWFFTSTSGIKTQIYSVGSENPPELLLDVKSAQINDSGVYSCHVEFGNHIWSSSGRLAVPGYLNITRPPNTQTVKLGDRAIFLCDAVGYPAPTIRWQKMIGLTISNVTSGVTATSSGSELVIDNVSAVDEGLYTCVASSAFGSTEAWAALTVNDSTSTPSTRTTLSTTVQSITSGLRKWHLQVFPPNQIKKVGEIATFQCSFDVVVSETVIVKWSFTNTAGATIDVYSGRLGSPDLTFYVKNLEKSDSGTYTCEASLGKTTWTAKGTLSVSA